MAGDAHSDKGCTTFVLDVSGAAHPDLHRKLLTNFLLTSLQELIGLLRIVPQERRGCFSLIAILAVCPGGTKILSKPQPLNGVLNTKLSRLAKSVAEIPHSQDAVAHIAKIKKAVGISQTLAQKYHLRKKIILVTSANLAEVIKEVPSAVIAPAKLQLIGMLQPGSDLPLEDCADAHISFTYGAVVDFRELYKRWLYNECCHSIQAKVSFETKQAICINVEIRCSILHLDPEHVMNNLKDGMQHLKVMEAAPFDGVATSNLYGSQYCITPALADSYDEYAEYATNLQRFSSLTQMLRKQSKCLILSTPRRQTRMFFLLIPTTNNSKASLQQLVTSEMYLGASCDGEDLLESQDAPIDPDINASVTSLRTRLYNPLNFSSNVLDTSSSNCRKAEATHTRRTATKAASAFLPMRDKKRFNNRVGGPLGQRFGLSGTIASSSSSSRRSKQMRPLTYTCL